MTEGLKDEFDASKVILWVGGVVVTCLVLYVFVLPHFIRQRRTSYAWGCKSNLKNYGTALEMYASDWSDHYPRNLTQLTPNYLKTLPDCPNGGTNQYYYSTGTGTAYNTAETPFIDYYFISCEGPFHTGQSVPAGYPQYDGIQGLIER